VDVSDLKKMPTPELLVIADGLALPDTLGLSKPELILRIGRAVLAQGQELRGDGTLEILPEG